MEGNKHMKKKLLVLLAFVLIASGCGATGVDQTEHDEIKEDLESTRSELDEAKIALEVAESATLEEKEKYEDLAKDFEEYKIKAEAELKKAKENLAATTAEATEGPDQTYTPEPANYNVPFEYSTATAIAKEYLDLTAFSYMGLIEQLEFEGFPTDVATYGVDHCAANWYEQAVRKSEQYLELMAFSRINLIEQLVFEGFTEAEAIYAADAVGL